MKLFMCLGGAAAVVDDEAAARHRGDQQRGRSLSFRAKFLSGKKGGKRKPPAPSPRAESKRRGVDADDLYGGVFGRPSTASSVASSTLLSSTASLNSDSSSSSSSSSSRPSNASSSAASVSGVLFQPAAKRRANKGSSSPAAGAAAVVLCLLMVVFCGRVGATLLTSTALYLFPRRWPARAHGEDGAELLESDADEETTARRKVVMDQEFLVRNRKK